MTPSEVAGIREIERAGVFENGRCAVSMRGGVTYEIYHEANTVRKNLGYKPKIFTPEKFLFSNHKSLPCAAQSAPTNRNEWTKTVV